MMVLSEKTLLLGSKRKPSSALSPNFRESADSDAVSGDELHNALNGSGQHSRSQNGLGVMLTSFFIVAQVAGLGVLALPWAVAQMGYAGIAMLAGAGIIIGFSASHLGKCWIILEERWPEYQRACRKPYPAIAYRTLGIVGWHLVNVVHCVTLFGVSTVTILLSGGLLNYIFESLVPNLTICHWLAIIGCSFIPLSWLGSPKDFWQGSVLALVATVAAIIVVIIKVIVDNPQDPPTYSPPTISSFFLGFGTVMFSYGGAITFPTIQNDMADRKKFPLTVVISFMFLQVLYLPVAGLGYWEFGDKVTVNILLSVHGISVAIVSALMLINNAFTYVLLVNPLCQSLEDALDLPHNFGWRRIIIRTSLVVSGILISLAVQDFGKVLNLIGSFAVPLLSFILPPIFYMRLCDNHTDEIWPRRNIGIFYRLTLCSVIIIGVVLCVVATYTSIVALLTGEEGTGSCF